MTITTTHHAPTAAAARRAAVAPARRRLRPSLIDLLRKLFTRGHTARPPGLEEWHRIEFGMSGYEDAHRSRPVARTPLDPFRIR